MKFWSKFHFIIYFFITIFPIELEEVEEEVEEEEVRRELGKFQNIKIIMKMKTKIRMKLMITEMVWKTGWRLVMKTKQSKMGNLVVRTFYCNYSFYSVSGHRSDVILFSFIFFYFWRRTFIWFFFTSAQNVLFIRKWIKKISWMLKRSIILIIFDMSKSHLSSNRWPWVKRGCAVDHRLGPTG